MSVRDLLGEDLPPRIRTRLVEQLYAVRSSVVVSSAFGIFLVGALVAQRMADILLAVLAVAAGLITLGFVPLVSAFQRRTAPDDAAEIERWEGRYAILACGGSIAAGAMAARGFVVSNDAVVHFILSSLCLAGVATVLRNCVRPRILLIQLAALVALPTAALPATGEPVYAVLALGGVALSFSMAQIGLGLYQSALGALMKDSELQAHNTRFQAALDNMRHGLCMFDADRRVVVYNQRYLEMFGLDAAVVRAGASLREILEHSIAVGNYPAGSIDDALARLTSFASNEPVSFRHSIERGRTFVVTHQPMAGGGWVATFEDITEQLAGEAALRESERRLATLVGNLPGMAYRCEAAAPWRMLYASSGAAALTGHAADSFATGELAWADVVHADDLAGLECVVAEAVANNQPFSAVYRIIAASGETKWVLERGQPVASPDAGPTCLEGFIGDITHQRTAEIALRDSEARLQAIVNTTPDCVMVVSADGRLIHMNPAGLAMIEAGSGAGVADADASEIVAPEHRSTWRRNHSRVVAGRQMTWDFDIVGLAGTRRHLETHAVPLPMPDGTTAQLAVTRDVTEQRHAEAKLRQLQSELVRFSRVSAMDAMGAAIAHEINQPLAAATNYLQAGAFILDKRGDGDPLLRETMAAAAAQTLRAGEIIRRLRAVARKGEAEKRTEELAPLVEEAMSLAASTTGADMSVKFDFAPGLAVMVDRVQIQQVLLNLVRNAAEAMQGQDRRELLISAAIVRDHVVVHVEDTGPGLPPEVRANLFAPFTSAKDGGMGIGLSICRAIVEAHSGDIWAEDVETGGTRFCFTVPVAVSEMAGRAPEDAAA